MASSTPNLLPVLTSDMDIELPISVRKEKTAADITNNDISIIRTTALQTSQYADIPQWKKDLIQRRKSNIAKTTVLNQSLTSANKATLTSTVIALSPSPESSFFAKNIDNLLVRSSNAHTIEDAMSDNCQQPSASAVNSNHIPKMPAALPQQGEREPGGGHYTQVNNKSSDSYNYNETLPSRSVFAIQQENAIATRSLGLVEKKTNNDSNPTSLQDEITRFRKNLTEQHETTNTLSSESVIMSTSRLSSRSKATEAETYKNSNKEYFAECVSQQPIHVLREPVLTTNVSNNNSNGGGDDENPLHHQLKFEHESNSLSSESVNVACAKEPDLKLFLINNNENGNISPLPKVVLNKKPCGILNAAAKLSPSYIKNQNIGSTTLVSSHHNYKINAKYRINQSNISPIPLSTSSAIEAPTALTNNKKKMVAVQEMNEITNNELDFNTSEELQYGPGIVSKLRCRYLSLALRQSIDKQRLSIDTLRRATSLNNLLDGNEVHDEDDDVGLINNGNKEESNSSLSTQQLETKCTSVNLNETVVGFNKNNNHPSCEINTGRALAYGKQHRSRHFKRGNDSLKRARSVEALLCEKSPWNFSNSQPTMFADGDTVTIEDKINNARDRLPLFTDNPPKRLTSIIDDTERPPPDLVKQTLKIFEASANRKGHKLSRNIGGEVANKVANYKSIITQNKPPITFPKPPVSPKKSNQKKNFTEGQNVTSTPPTSLNTFSYRQAGNNMIQPLCSTPTESSRTLGSRQKMDFTPIKNLGSVSGADSLSENSPDIIPRNKLLDKALPPIGTDSPVTDLNKKIEKFRNESAPTTQIQEQSSSKELLTEYSDRESEDDDSIDGEYIVNSEECSSNVHISQSALIKGGIDQFQTKSCASVLNGNLLAKHSEPLHDIPTLSTSGATSVKQIGVIRPLLIEPQHKENKSIIGCIEENVNIQATSLTSREIEKNRINNEKKIETSGVNSSMDKSGCVGFTGSKVIKNVVSSATTTTTTTTFEQDEGSHTSAWSSAIISRKKRNPVGDISENNSMVFNFKDRKEVPDYIDNDGLIFKRKRELPKPNESGFVLLGDLSLETSTDPEDEWPMSPPSPCDVEFENAHVIIDGKSSIKNRFKEGHFRVKFNDTLTSTFEYPSELSAIEDSSTDCPEMRLNASYASKSLSTSTSSAHILGNLSHASDSPIIHHHHVTVDEIIQLPQNNKETGSLSLGSAPLGSYTPVKANIETIFQLGVTRVPNTQPDKSLNEVQSSETKPADCYEEFDSSSLEYLRPASDDLTIAYSEGSLKTDLLY